MTRQAMSARARSLVAKLTPLRPSMEQRRALEVQQKRHEQRLNRQRRQIDSLRLRVEELEEELTECMRLNKRVAEVTDIVAEVLMPAAHRDEEELRRRLERYAETL